MVKHVVKLGFQLPISYLETAEIYAREIRVIALKCPRLREVSIFLDLMLNGARDYIMPVLEKLPAEVKEKTGRALTAKFVGISWEDARVSDSESDSELDPAMGEGSEYEAWVSDRLGEL